MRAPLLVLAWPLSLLASTFWACSGHDASTGAAASADAGGPTDDSAAAATDADAEAAIGDRRGTLFAISDSTTIDGGARDVHSVGASFTTGGGADPSVTTRTVGPCVVEVRSTGDGPTEIAVSAGPLHLTGGLFAVDILPTAGVYAAINGAGALFHGGETLTVTADGKDVPAFTVAVTAPSQMTLTAPALPAAAGSLTVTRSAPFIATWTGGTSGTAVLAFSAATSARATSATCAFPAADNKAEVPAAALADLPAAPGAFDFYVKATGLATPAGWPVRFTVSRAAVDGRGVAASGAATFQ
jgi:hypothetical protein